MGNLPRQQNHNMKTYLELPETKNDNLSHGETLDHLAATIRDDEAAIILEAAWFAMRHHFDSLAEYLDVDDETLLAYRDKLDKRLED
jgi:hypothetical protein